MFYLYVIDPNLLTRQDHIDHYARVGALICTSTVRPPNVPGTAIKNITRPGPNDLWDESAQDLVYSRRDRFISVKDYFYKFTEAELDLYYVNATDRVLKTFNHYASMEKLIDLDSTWAVNVTNALVTTNILTSQRAAEILA